MVDILQAVSQTLKSAEARYERAETHVQKAGEGLLNAEQLVAQADERLYQLRCEAVEWRIVDEFFNLAEGRRCAE